MKNEDHRDWCAKVIDGSACDCGSRTLNGRWVPHRGPKTEVGAGWHGLIERLDLKRTAVDRHFVLHGQDGWAFEVAVRFQVPAHGLAKTRESFYWSGYHLLALIIERARTDMTFLEAMESLALASMTKADTTEQLKRMGVWP